MHSHNQLAWRGKVLARERHRSQPLICHNTSQISAAYAPHGALASLQVMIVDFDVHHGNGTMDAFYDDPSVLYVSTHQAGLWPYTGKARDAGGRGPGAGCTVNVPLPGGAGDEAMRQVGGSCWKGGEGRR